MGPPGPKRLPVCGDTQCRTAWHPSSDDPDGLLTPPPGLRRVLLSLDPGCTCAMSGPSPRAPESWLGTGSMRLNVRFHKIVVLSVNKPLKE